MLIWFVALYLLATVAIGFYASTRVHNTRDFASGGRSMGFPIVAAILISLTIAYLFTYIAKIDVFAMVQILMKPVTSFAQSAPGVIMIVFLQNVFYFFGVSGWVFTPVTRSITQAAIAENAELVAAGLAPKNIYAYGFSRYHHIGGQGATLPLALFMLRAKSKKFRLLGKATLVPSIFNINEPIIFGAIAWNLVTWYFGIPSSSSHALVGGLIGAVVVSAGTEHVVWGFAELRNGHLTGIVKVLAALVLSPLIGFWVGFLIHRLLNALLMAANPAANARLRGLQFVTAAGLAFAHGANDAQKSMGILTLVLLLGGFIPSFAVPFWVMLACASAITLGILSGGWRIVRTLGFAIYRVRPIHALGSQLTSAGVIMAASLGGAPVSTTHVVATSIMGIGASERPRAVRWAKAKDIATTWIVTIPGAALVAIQAYALVNLFLGGKA